MNLTELKTKIDNFFKEISKLEETFLIQYSQERLELFAEYLNNKVRIRDL